MRPGVQFVVALPDGEKAVGITTHKDRVFVATETRVYELVGDKLEPLLLVEQEEGVLIGVKRPQPLTCGYCLFGEEPHWDGETWRHTFGHECYDAAARGEPEVPAEVPVNENAAQGGV